MSKYCVIEGIIGCGKSTLLSLLKRSNLEAEYYEEPYHLFTKYKSFNPMIEFSNDSKLNASIAQLHIIRQSCFYYPKKDYKSPKMIISERCVLSPNFFIEASRKMKMFSAFTEEFLKSELIDLSHYNLMPDHIIYLNIDPLCAWKRVISRNRYAERNCSLSYQSVLHNVYMHQLLQYKPKIKVTILDIASNNTRQEVLEKVLHTLKDAEE